MADFRDIFNVLPASLFVNPQKISARHTLKNRAGKMAVFA